MTSQHLPFRDTIAAMEQYPLHFACKETDRIAKHLTSFGNTFQESIVYMGPRYTNSYQLFKSYSKNEPKQDSKEESSSYEHAEFYRKSRFDKYSFDCGGKRWKVVPVRADQYRLFRGMNPTVSKDQLKFDSNFECGNLDLAVKVSTNEYDLFMRVDSNTKGHTCWFFFKVTQFKYNQTVKFNIYNFSRQDLMYNSRYKITTFTSCRKEWTQEGKSIVFDRPERCCYFDENGGACCFNRNDAFCLSFDYKFNPHDEYVYFAYCIPYSYSYMLNYVEEIKTKHKDFMTVSTDNRSTGGLKIPVITIDNHKCEQLYLEQYKRQNRKPVCLIIGRLHPGEAQASWILQGFINFLCSPEAAYLRDYITFKIIPMINVDGVVLGNFRTGLIGRDLNRLFKKPELSKQVYLVRSIAGQHKPFVFLDFHGHSSKKYVFTYGPDYSIDHQYFLQSRLFPKLLGKSSGSFRYYASSFRIAQNRNLTARAVILREFSSIFSYTVETSVYGYGPKSAEKLFGNNELIIAGEQMGSGFQNFIRMIFALPKRLQMGLQSPLRNHNEPKNKIFLRRQKSKSPSPRKYMNKDTFRDLSQEQRQLVQEIYVEEQNKIGKKEQASDDSDFQEGQDYTDCQLVYLLKEEPRKPAALKIKGLTKQQKKKSHNPAKIAKTLTENNVRESFEQIIIERRVETRMREPTQRSIRSRIYREVPSVEPFLNRKQFGKSKYSSIFVSPDTQSSKGHQKHSSCAEQIYTSLNTSIQKVSFVNPVIFKNGSGYILNGYQPFSQTKIQSNRSRQYYPPSDSLNLKNRKPQIRASRNKMTLQTKLRIKKTALPVLGRNDNLNPVDSKSMIEDIIEKHDKIRMNKPKKQLKMIQF